MVQAALVDQITVEFMIFTPRLTPNLSGILIVICFFSNRLCIRKSTELVTVLMLIPPTSSLQVLKRNTKKSTRSLTT